MSPDLTSMLIERNARYGVFYDHAYVTQELKRVLYRHMASKWDALAPDQREALEMIVHKIGRIANGDPDYADSWVDIAGYARLVADRLEGTVR